MIEVRGLTKNYGQRLAIDNLNFTVAKGEVVGFLGPNGAGKSTTMKIITGYMAPTLGEVKVAGHDVFEKPVEVKRHIGYLPETPPVYGEMRVDDYLAYVARLKGIAGVEVNSAVNRALDKTGLQESRKRMIQNLSKGFKQRVGLSQALVGEPEILILDEPTVGLDPKQVQEVRRLIQDLRGKHTIILSTHILPEVQASCERIIIINRGKIIAEDSLVGLAKRMGGGTRLTIKLRRNFETVNQSIGSLEGVLSTRLEGNQIFAETDGKEETSELVAAHVVERGAGLLELRSEGRNLEDIFIQLTSSSEAAQNKGAN